MAFEYDVFLSYNRSDPRATDARLLRNDFRTAGFNVFLDENGLTEGKARPLDEAIPEALARSRLILVLVGSRGLGQYQGQKEVPAALELAAADGQAGGRPWPEVVLVRLDRLEHEQILDKVPEALSAPLSYVFPPSHFDPSVGELINKLREDPATAAAAKPDRSMRKQAANGRRLPLDEAEFDDLALQIRKNGLTIFLGSRWSDRFQAGTYDPNAFAKFLREECGLPEDVHAAPERLASYAQFKLGDDSRIVRELRCHHSARAPAAYRELATLLDRACGQRDRDQRSQGRPFVVVTTAQNGLLEIELLLKRISFLVIHVDRDNCRQVLFHIENDDPLTLGSGRKLAIDDGRSAYLTPDVQALLDGYQGGAVSWRDAVPQVLDTDRPDVPVPPEEYNCLRQYVFNGGTAEDDRRAWFAYKLGTMIEHQSRTLAIETRWNPEGSVRRQRGRGQAGLRSDGREETDLINWCKTNQFPIIVKLGGCVYADSKLGMRLDRIATLGLSGDMFPNWLVTAIRQTPTLFAGFSPVEYGFQTFYWRELDTRFAERDWREHLRLFFSPEVVDGDEAGNADPIDLKLAEILPDRRAARVMPDLQFITGVRPSDVLKELNDTWPRAGGSAR